jgi:hypothetical protein
VSDARAHACTVPRGKVIRDRQGGEQAAGPSPFHDPLRPPSRSKSTLHTKRHSLTAPLGLLLSCFACNGERWTVVARPRAYPSYATHVCERDQSEERKQGGKREEEITGNGN